MPTPQQGDVTVRRALVAGVFGAYYHVLPLVDKPSGKENIRLLAKTRGKLRIDYREKNEGYNKLRESLLAIGDVVTIADDARNSETCVITGVEPRRNAIHRASFGRQQCLAANVDGVVVIASVAAPAFNLGFIERCLAEVNIAGVDVLLIANKCDLVTEIDDNLELILSWYERIGIAVFRESLLQGPTSALQERLTRGTWLLLGQSGTGKSTLLNKILGADLQVVGDVSLIQKGRHTTTNPALYTSASHGELALIDVPGLREFGLHHREPSEIRTGYPDFMALQCRFENCLHLNEPGCGVKAALADGDLPEFRYRSYVGLLDTVNENFKPRKGDYWRGIKK